MLARLARVGLVIALFAGWQAALAHSIEHSGEAHEESSLCDSLDALTACAPDAVRPPFAPELLAYFCPPQHRGVPRVAEAPPFLSHGPPIALA